jgi:hypothetical protein
MYFDAATSTHIGSTGCTEQLGSSPCCVASSTDSVGRDRVGAEPERWGCVRAQEQLALVLQPGVAGIR